MTATRLASRALIRLSPQQEGEDVAQFLQGLVTQDVTGALPVWAGLLTPQGKALFDFIVWADGADLLLDCEADAADALAKRLAIYRLRRPITIARDPGLAVHWRAEREPGRRQRSAPCRAGHPLARPCRRRAPPAPTKAGARTAWRWA